MMNTVSGKAFLRRVLAGLAGLLAVVSAWVNPLFLGDVYPYESVSVAAGLDALDRSQGVTTDGLAWIFSGKETMVRVSLDDSEELARNDSAIPDELRTRFGSAHIGGISYANDHVYAAIEDSGQWLHPIVALFDARTLEYTGTYIELPGKDSTAENAMTHGVPWVTCDPVNGYFYVAQCNDADRIFVYDLQTNDYVRAIPLSEPVDEIQGAEMYNGRLYAATNDATRAVYQISLRTGTVTKYFDRIMYQSKWIDNFGGEGEDVTVLPMRDGTVFHALNIGALFVDANLRHYKPVDPDLPYEEMEDKPVVIDDPVDPIPRPDVTYLDKYVLDVLRGGSYTIKATMTMEGNPLSFSYYADADNLAVEMNIAQSLANALILPIRIDSSTDLRFIMKTMQSDPHVYLAFGNLGYVELDADLEDSVKEQIYASVKDMDTLLGDVGAYEYCGLESKAGYIVESYKCAETNEKYCFYFDGEGLAKWEVIDLSTGRYVSSTKVRLTTGVADQSVFSVSGVKLTEEDLEKWLHDLVPSVFVAG